VLWETIELFGGGIFQHATLDDTGGYPENNTNSYPLVLFVAL
jgi:hypothetical protein